MLRYGKISAVYPDKRKYEVTFDEDGLVSMPLPYSQVNTKENKTENTLDLEEHVWCLMDEFCEYGIIGGCIYDEENLPIEGNADITRTQYKDGSFIQYDRAAKKFTASFEGDVEIIKATNINVIAEKVTFNDGENDGIPLVNPLVSKINALESQINSILAILKTTVIPLAPTGTYPFATLYASVNPIAPVTNKNDLQNPDILQ